MKFCSVLLCCFSIFLLQTTNVCTENVNDEEINTNSVFEAQNSLSDSSINSGQFNADNNIVQQNFSSRSTISSSSSSSSSSTSSSSSSSSAVLEHSEPYQSPAWIFGLRDNEHVDYETFGILFSNEPITGLTRRCMLNIPEKHRRDCLAKSYGTYSESRYGLKTRCCAKWAQLDCLEGYSYNAIYCSILEQITIRRFFNKLRSLEVAPECAQYRPIKEENKKWSATLGRIASCAVPVQAEITNRFPDRPL